MHQNKVWLGFYGLNPKIYAEFEISFAVLYCTVYKSCDCHSGFLIACWIQMISSVILCRQTHLYPGSLGSLASYPFFIYQELNLPMWLTTRFVPILQYSNLAGHRSLIYYEVNLPTRRRASRAQKGKSIFLRICFSSELDIDMLIFCYKLQCEAPDSHQQRYVTFS